MSLYDKGFLEERILRAGVLGTDLMHLFIGELIGKGASREVYNFCYDVTKIIKVELAGTSFNNVEEWEIWRSLLDNGQEDLQKWFAPCRAISPCGVYLIQARTTPISKEQLPAKVPSFLTDLKIENWGMFEGRPVCHDYANNLIRANVTARMRKAEWWSQHDPL